MKIVQISAGRDRSVVLASDGTAHGWGGIKRLGATLPPGYPGELCTSSPTEITTSIATSGLVPKTSIFEKQTTCATATSVPRTASDSSSAGNVCRTCCISASVAAMVTSGVQ